MQRVSVLIAFSLISIISHSSEIAYYGERFYREALDKDNPTLSPQEAKKFIRFILIASHVKTEGFDRILKSCPGRLECYKQKKLDYRMEVRPAVMAIIDSKKTNSRNKRYVATPYCNKRYSVEYRDGKYHYPHSNNFNVEHTFPRSRFKRSPEKSLMTGDLHHLFAVKSEINQLRGSHHFNNLPGKQYQIVNCKSSEFGKISGRSFFEPPKEHKGNVARAMLYFALRYNVYLKKPEVDVYLDWHKRDPVDLAERRRVERIFKIQKNRNPFIDFPNLVPYLGKTLVKK